MSSGSSQWRILPAGKLARLLTSAGPGFYFAVLIGVVSVTLNVLAARQLIQIGNDSRELAHNWVARTAGLASLQDQLADFRQREAQLALTVDLNARRELITWLETTMDGVESKLALVAGLSTSPEDARQASALLTAWSEYRRRHYESRRLATGSNSDALAAFRAREAAFNSLMNQTRVARDRMTEGLDTMALRNQRSTRISTILLVSSIGITVGIFLVMIALRRTGRAKIIAERRLMSVIDQSLGIVWETGRTGRLRYCSKAGYDLLRLEPASATGTRVLRFIHPDDRRRLLDAAHAALASGHPLSDIELRIVAADGSQHWVAVSGMLAFKDANPLQSRRLIAGRGLAVDVTRRYQAEQALAQNRRLEALGTLAGGVAHDLNNVFTAINGYTDLALEQAENSPQLVSDLSAIDAAAQRGTLLVRRILQFARQQVREPRVVSVRDTVQEVVQLLRPQTPPHVHIHVDGLESDCRVWADPTELHQLIVNIASNGLHAMTKEGSTLRISLESDGSRVRITITDDGIGMPESVLERALEPFFTTRPVGEGTGMGLSVAHGVVKALHGNMKIASRAGEGTSVAIDLPQTHDEGLPAANATSDHGANGGHGARVMLVDDDDQVRNSVARILRQAGCSIVPMSSAHDAINALGKPGEEFDLIITDFTMPGMSGLELAETLAQMRREIPVVLVSGYLDDATMSRAEAVGITRVLDKPVSRQTLLEVIGEVATRPTGRDAQLQ